MIIGYTRISTQRQSDGTSLDNQKQKIEDYCRLNDLELTNIFSEIDSGGNDDRKVINEIKNMIENPFLKDSPIKTIIVFKLDRLGRTMLGSLQFIEMCKEHNVNVVSISDNIDTSEPKSELILNILLSIATEERRVIKERLTMGRDYKFKNNQIPYSKIPFGYTRKNKTIIPDKNSEVVQYIFKKWNVLNKMKHLTKTKKTQRLLSLLKQRGYTFNGRDFKWWNVRDILNNKMYCGELTWKGLTTTSSYPTIISKRLFNNIHN
jgi:site-specific DNA recombinase